MGRMQSPESKSDGTLGGSLASIKVHKTTTPKKVSKRMRWNLSDVKDVLANDGGEKKGRAINLANSTNETSEKGLVTRNVHPIGALLRRNVVMAELARVADKRGTHSHGNLPRDPTKS